MVTKRLQFDQHTDYAGGRSLIAATEQGFAVAAVGRNDASVTVTDVKTGDRIALVLGRREEQPVPGWGTYARAVVERVAQNFPAATWGVDIAFASDLPPAAGLSSSSALVVGLFLAIGWANEIERQPAYETNIATREDLAAYLATIENGLGFVSLVGRRGVGTFGGSEDHTAILCSRAGHVRQYAFCPTRLEREVALPSDVVFAVASSGVAAEKTGAAMHAYNRVSALASRLVEIWNLAASQPAGSLAEACAASPDAVGRLFALEARGAGSASINKATNFFRSSPIR